MLRRLSLFSFALTLGLLAACSTSPPEPVALPTAGPDRADQPAAPAPAVTDSLAAK
jgi:hypothetical protein